MRRLLTVVAVLIAAMASAPALAHADDPSLVPTPPMGFNDWNAYGCHVDAGLIESQARFIHDSGLQRDGYRYVNIDDCWLAPHRSANGSLVANPQKFPHGIAAVADDVHRLGLKLGIYEDAGTRTCAGYPGSFGHMAQDARTFASWGVDYLKLDQCYVPFSRFPGLTREQVDTRLYTTMSRDLQATGRPIVFSMCNGWDRAARPWLWGARVSNLWRTTHDIKDDFASTVNNFTGTVGLWRHAHAGAFNDPDALEIGNGGQTLTEYRSQFSLWAEMAAPLIAGTNLEKLPRADLAIYENRRVIAVDQDPLARQGHPISHHGGLWALSKPLRGGDHAVALFNATAVGQTIAVSARAAGQSPAGSYGLQNLWSGRVTRSAGRIAAFVPAHGTVMYRVSSAHATATAPQTELALTTTAAPGGVRARVSLRDDAPDRLVASTVTLTAPAGWTPRHRTVALGALRPGAGAARTVSLRRVARPTQPISVSALRATVRVHGAGGPSAEQLASTALETVVPVRAPERVADLTGQPVTAGALGEDLTITAAGTGIAVASSGPTPPTGARHVVPADDSYAAVAETGAASPGSVATVTVRRQTGSPLGPVGQTGLIERDRLAAGTPEGVALSVSTAGMVSLDWATHASAVVDHAVTAPATVTLPVTLRLRRDGSRYVGSYSTDGGRTWRTVASAAVTGTGAGDRAQDLGVFHSSGTAGWFTTAQVSGFTVTR